MDTRKIQITGGSTYIISLPKKWVDATGLSSGDLITVIPKHDGTLLIDPKISSKRIDTSKKTVFLKSDEPYEHVLRKLIGAYISGYTIIEIKATSFQPALRQAVRSFTKKVIGTEIIDETTNSITIHDLVDPTELPITKSIRRMYLITKSMFEDALKALKNRDTQLAEDVVIRDDEVNRLYWLVAKQYSMIMRNPSLSEKTGQTGMESLAYLLVARIIERIGDHACKISQNVLSVIDKKVPSGIVRLIDSICKDAIQIYEDAIYAMYECDTNRANKSIDFAETLSTGKNKLLQHLLDSTGKGRIAVSFAYILDSIDRIASYSADISEIAINYTAGLAEQEDFVRK